jgi:hypothetical protein
MSAYLLATLQSPVFAALGRVGPASHASLAFAAHPGWNEATGCKLVLNNLCLVLQPFIYASLLLPWLHLVPLPHLHACLAYLYPPMNSSQLGAPSGTENG